MSLLPPASSTIGSVSTDTGLVAWLLTCFFFSSSSGTVLGLLTKPCYSCMSKTMETYWEHLSKIYNRPVNFTDDCNEPIKHSTVGVHHCNTVCLTLIESAYVSGTYVGKHYIRGCLTDITRWGFINRTMRDFERYDICKEVNRDDLFKNVIEQPGTMHVCSCYGDRCNGAGENAAVGHGPWSYPFVMISAWGLYYYFVIDIR